jgi:anaerobic magnesium-protoporphyrin IX monomethyl ester cyclase
VARVLLVNPPFYRLLGSHYNGMSLGLSYIASMLNANGHDSWVYNADYNRDPTYKTLHQIFEDYPRLKLDFTPENPCIKECLDGIVAFRPDWIGYTCYTAVVPVVDSLTREIKRHLPDARQVVGGPHPSLDPITSERIPWADYVVRGEGEFAMRMLVDGAIRGLPKTMQSSRISDLDALPFPERTKLLPGDGGADLSYLSTARGCPWRCAYCASPTIWPRVHARSPANVITEAHDLPRLTKKAESGGDVLRITDNASLYIIDDTFTFNEQRAIEIMKGLDMPWKCEARADTITENLASAMSQYGCVRAKLGVESGSERILKLIGKGETKDDIRAGIRLLQKYDVPVTIYLMTGFPGETDDDLRQTIAFAKELHPDYCSISIVAPYYGTRLYRDAMTAGVPVDRAPWECFFHHNDALLLNKNLSRGLIEELWSLCDVRKYA